MKNHIPIYEPFIGEEEENNVNQCLKSNWISSRGKFIDEFESKVKNYIGSEFASSVSNGTTAIHLALLTLGIGKDDEVITTNFTYVASTNAILMVGANPVFVEIDKETWNINTNEIIRRITSKTKAILVTNVYGLPCDFNALHKICSANNLFLIEDAAESFGAEFNGQKSGGLADVSTFSFFGNKTITTGEGGMVLTKSKILHEKIEQLKNQGNSPTKKYFHERLGYNYRMTNIQAAIGCAQIDKIDKILTLKRNIDSVYRLELKKYVQFQQIKQNYISSHWMTSILFENYETKKNIEKQLKKNSVETRPMFFPIDELPFYTKDSFCNNAKELYNRGLTLPSFPSLKENQQEHIIKIIKNNV